MNNNVKVFAIVSGVLVNPADCINPHGRYDSIVADIRIRGWINSQSK